MAKTTIRMARASDAEAIAAVHYDAVHSTAAADYRAAIIEQWAQPIDAARIAEFRDSNDREVRVLAEMDGEVVGFGAIIPVKNELRACYVSPKAGRLGVGSMIVRELERIARAAGLTHLEMDSSLTAETFYRANGFETMERSIHRLGGGTEMECIKMRKRL